MRKIFGKVLLSLLVISGTLVACSESISEPKYEFKKASKEGLAAKYGDIKITHEELESGIESEIYEARQKLFDLKFSRLKSLVLKKMIEKDPKAKGLSVDEFIEKNIVSKVDVSESDVKEFIKKKNIPQEHINETIKGRITKFLKMEKKGQYVDKWMAQKTNNKPIEVYLDKPRPPVFDVQVGDAPVWGTKNAKVTIIEYSDFQCPFCAKGADVISEIKQEYKGKVKIAFKHFPLPFHKDAKPAAIASMCVHEQDKDKFWKYHDKLFDNQSALKTTGLTRMAKELGIDEKKFAVCLDQKKYADYVEKDIEKGKELGVKSTPTFYVNGMLINGAQPLEVFKELIDQELK